MTNANTIPPTNTILNHRMQLKDLRTTLWMYPALFFRYSCRPAEPHMSTWETGDMSTTALMHTLDRVLRFVLLRILSLLLYVTLT